MDVSNSTSSSSSTTSSQTSSAQSALSDNYDMFLELLTVQIKNQNPLDPMDVDKFTDQLTQFSSVEQQITTNRNLETMIESMSASNLSSVVNYIGKEVEANGATTVLKNGQAQWSATTSQDATGTVTIKNSAGATIYTEKVALPKGSSTYQWDGRSSVGGTAPDGQYTIAFDVQNASGTAVNVETTFSGVVDEVDLANGDPTLKIGNVTIPLSSVKTIRNA